jgi:hypothetical protein
LGVNFQRLLLFLNKKNFLMHNVVKFNHDFKGAVSTKTQYLTRNEKRLIMNVLQTVRS